MTQNIGNQIFLFFLYEFPDLSHFLFPYFDHRYIMFNVRILTKMDIGIPIFIGNRSNEFPL